MSLARKYRLQFATQRGDRLTLYLAAALAFHLGAITGGMVLWPSDVEPLPTPEWVESEPIKFVYLEEPESDEAEDEVEVEIESELQSNVSAVAGGDRQPEQPENAGKLELEKPIEAIALNEPKPLTQPASAVLEPSSVAAQVPSGAVLLPTPASDIGNKSSAEGDQKPEEFVAPWAPPVSPQAATLPPEASPPEALPPTPLPAIPAEMPPLAALPTLEPALPISEPVAEEAVAEEVIAENTVAENTVSENTVSENTVSEDVLPDVSDAVSSEEIADETATPAVAVPSQEPNLAVIAPVPEGQGLDGTLNPNRTAAGPAGIDAERDAVLGDYIENLTRQVNEHWQRVNVDSSRETKVRFTVNRQGELMDLELVNSSQSEQVDEAAMDAVRAAAPFEPLPEVVAEELIVINFQFRYNAPRNAAPR